MNLITDRVYYVNQDTPILIHRRCTSRDLHLGTTLNFYTLDVNKVPDRIKDIWSIYRGTLFDR